MIGCDVCNPGVEDLGFEMPDVRAQYVASVSSYDACPKCKSRDITVVDEGFHWHCNRPGCREEFYDTVTARCTITRAWEPCPDCDERGEQGMHFTCAYILTLPDDRKFTFKSEDECFRVFKALYPDAKFDQEWADDRRTMFMENGGRY